MEKTLNQNKPVLLYWHLPFWNLPWVHFIQLLLQLFLSTPYKDFFFFLKRIYPTKWDMYIFFFYHLVFLFHLLKPSHWLHFPSMFEYLLKNLNCSLRATARFQTLSWAFFFLLKLLFKFKEVNKVDFSSWLCMKGKHLQIFT